MGSLYARLFACTALSLAYLSQSEASFAQTRHRDRWTQTLAFGATVGIGGPLGLVGASVEYRGWRYASLSVGLGAGG